MRADIACYGAAAAGTLYAFTLPHFIMDFRYSNAKLPLASFELVSSS